MKINWREKLNRLLHTAYFQVEVNHDSIKKAVKSLENGKTVKRNMNVLIIRYAFIRSAYSQTLEKLSIVVQQDVKIKENTTMEVIGELENILEEVLRLQKELLKNLHTISLPF